MSEPKTIGPPFRRTAMALSVPQPEESWPTPVQRAWGKAVNAMVAGEYESATVMVRRGIEAAIRELGGKGRTMKDKIDDLVGRAVIRKDAAKSAHSVRQLGNIGAHYDSATPELYWFHAMSAFGEAGFFLFSVYSCRRQSSRAAPI